MIDWLWKRTLGAIVKAVLDHKSGDDGMAGVGAKLPKQPSPPSLAAAAERHGREFFPNGTTK